MTVTFSTDSMMRTAHGWVSLSDPQPHQIHIDDIQTALFNIHRFTGHSSISVLDHSCRAYLFASYEMGIEDPRQLLTVLLHDAQEAYVGDLSSPIKAMLREHTTVYDVIEQRFADVIARKWDLDDISADYVKEADQRALAAEVEHLWGPLEVSAWGLDRQDRLASMANPEAARQLFKSVFWSLRERMANG